VERQSEELRDGSQVLETKLPGLGIKYEFVTSRGNRLGVVHHRTGRRELVVYDPEDPDAARDVVALSESDSRTLAELLGGSQVAEELDRLHQVEGLAIDWLPLQGRSRFAGRPLGDTEARTRTGVSIVAIIREDQAFAAPGPDFVLEGRDTLVVVGTPRGIEHLAVHIRSD
jgi:TrkA domain protein